MKASRKVAQSDFRGLAQFADYVGKKHHAMVWYMGTERTRIGDVDVLPWQEGLAAVGF